MKKEPISQRRLDALYKFKNSGNNDRALADFFLATAPWSTIKKAVEHFNLKTD